jgi:hypothetical protein
MMERGCISNSVSLENAARDLSDTLGGKPLLRVSLQRSFRSLPPFHGASGDESMRGRFMMGKQDLYQLRVGGEPLRCATL